MIFRIKKDADVRDTAVALVSRIRDGIEVEFQGIGSGAVNQMFKIVVEASGLLSHEGRELLAKLGYVNKKVDGEPRSVLSEKKDELSVAIMRFVIR